MFPWVRRRAWSKGDQRGSVVRDASQQIVLDRCLAGLRIAGHAEVSFAVLGASRGRSTVSSRQVGDVNRALSLLNAFDYILGAEVYPNSGSAETLRS